MATKRNDFQLGVTIVLTLYRPRLGGLVVGPALAVAVGLVLMGVAGHISLRDVAESWAVLWHALIAIASIMIIASAATTTNSVLDRTRKFPAPSPQTHQGMRLLDSPTSLNRPRSVVS